MGLAVRESKSGTDGLLKNTMHVLVSNIGRTRYTEAWELQTKLFNLRLDGLIDDVLLYTEHEHVYTIGKGGDANHLLASEEELKLGGIDLCRVDRGGDITYHGPGQVVGYPVLALDQYCADIHWYLRSLEEVIIVALGTFGIEAGREEGMTGVWVRGEKIAAIGVKVSRWVTMHGFALNVNTDLSKFDRIIPCGIFHKGVTSMQRLLSSTIDLTEVHTRLTDAFAQVIGCQPIVLSKEELMHRVNQGNIQRVEEARSTIG
jgi:lipoyl(octanoyl) transferase